ncbi:MAG: hypothetical protein KJ607_11225, partial [Bacteroidetes bacterium]|nr:hypothetical protein [Bacteroidota bacterium]
RIAVKKIRKNPINQKEIANLDKAYKLANDQDLNRIKFLRQEGNPDIWKEVFDRYSSLKARQELVKTVLPLQQTGNFINYPMVDYDKEIIAAKKNAAEYFYVHGQKLLEQGDKLSARQAYDNFQDVKEFYSDYRDIDKMIAEALAKGTSRVLVNVKNESMIKITREFEETVLNLDYTRLNSRWIEYYNEENRAINFDYLVNVRIGLIDILPEKILEEHITETKEVEDGWEYVLDQNGNVAKDSLGNDIKKPKFKIISCKVMKTKQTKVAHIEGKIDYVEKFTGKTLRTSPIAADNIFEHVSAMAVGDINALSEESKKIVGIKPLPFPPDLDMIHQAAGMLRLSVMDVLVNNKSLIK